MFSPTSQTWFTIGESEFVFPQWGQCGSKTDLRRNDFTQPQFLLLCISNQNLANFLQHIWSNVTMTMSTEIHPPIFFYISLFSPLRFSKCQAQFAIFNWMEAFSSLAPPHFFFSHSLYFFFLSIVAQTGGALSGLCHGWGVLLGPLKTHTHTHTCGARWVTAASRPGGKSLWRDARLSYALNLHSERLQDTKKKKRGCGECRSTLVYLAYDCFFMTWSRPCYA